MSPALVDPQIPTTTPRMQSTNPNASKGQISSPFLFGFSGFSSNNLQRKSSVTDSETMNASKLGHGAASRSGNANEANIDISFASPAVSRVASGKPSVTPSSGLSKPRFVKVRKHLAAQQVRAPPVSEARADSSFNPFRPVSAGLDQTEMRDLRDKWQSWNSISPGSAQKSEGSNAFAAASSTDIKFGKSGDAAFVFGANRTSVPNSNVEKSGLGGSVGKSSPDERRKLNIVSESEKKDSRDSTFSLSAGGRGSSSSGVLIFGSNSGKSSDFDSDNIEGSRNVMDAEKPKEANVSSKGSGESNFVFGGSDDGESMTSKIPEQMKENPTNADSNPKLKDENTFFGRGKVTAGFPDRSTSATIPPDEMKKLNMQGIGNDKNSVLYGSGTGTTGFPDGSTSATMLPDELKKLNIQGSGNDDSVVKPKGTNLRNSNIFVFRSSEKYAGSSGESVLAEEMRKSNIGDGMGDSTGQMNTSSSSRIFVKETQHVPAVENPIPTPFPFHTGLRGKNLGAGQVPSYQPNDENVTRLGGAGVSSSSFSSTSSGDQSVGNGFEMPSTNKAENKAENKSGFSFTSTRDGSGTPYTHLRTPKQHSFASSSDNLFADVNQKLEFNAKRGAVNDQRLKQRKGKLRQSAPLNHLAGQKHVSRENSFQENSESPRSYSPMDFSPYQEPLAGDEGSRENSMASDESFHIDNSPMSTDAHQTVSTDATAEVLTAETQHLHINVGLNDEDFNSSIEQNVGVDHSLDECLSGAETEGFRPKTENVDVDSDASAATTTTETSFGSNMEKQESNVRIHFTIASNSEDAGETSFTFSAPSSTQGHLSAAKRHYRKNRSRIGLDSFNFTQNSKLQTASTPLSFFPFGSSPLFSGASRSQKGDSSTSESKVEIRSETYKEPDIKQGSISIAALPTQEFCEKWRLRGNQAYANGQLSKAEDYYTRGVNCNSSNETSRSCLKDLVLCYSNRAATRMALGRMREALEDCKTAAAIDPKFLKVQVRAANCHLALGEIEEAAKYFKVCLQSGTGVCLDRKLVIEASDGLQKAQQVAQHIDRSIKLLCQRTSSDAEKVLQIVAEGLLISPYSEKLVEIKAEAHFMLRKFEAVIQLYEQTLDSAERNSLTVSSDCQLENMSGSSKGNKSSAERLWQLHLTSKSYFYLGKLEEALDLLEKQEILGTTVEKDRSKTVQSLMTFAATLRELLRHKAAGNEAFQSGRHSEAVEHYSAALLCNVESRPFAAICICNRAAAYQALGQLTDAIADCSLAIALDGNYPKAISRRATLHEMIRDYGQAVNDLERYISLLEKQSEDKTGAAGKSTSSANDLRQTCMRLSTMEEEARKGIPLDMYLILGVEPTATASDIKKAYRKAALRHHPDKAGQFFARTENGDDGRWKEIAEEVHKDADRLFKMIGEAYAILSDPTKRSRYDLEEELRNSQKKAGGNGTRTADVHNHPSERNASRRQWSEAWKSYGNSNHRWSEASRSNRYS
ncbi:uncharacterized protein LOC122642418 isoform X2 [Telopea speciosissima]|uniref:uncharacterized protein LOC122642418 isoform X2 n=1 Tax=Telopea speciosissima TaxID=54955 RepID=UPI001CC33BFC|nr:uncharacterized protein LOC122642418 isoform X2 [Telopea speciosissima]